MQMNASPKAILLISCPDQPGIIARVSNFIYKNKGNIVDVDQHTVHAEGLFLMRVEWQLEGFAINRRDLKKHIENLLSPLGASWHLYFSDERSRIAVWVSAQDHCLLDLLWRAKAGELAGEVAVIMSNHKEMEQMALQWDVPFAYVPIGKGNRSHEASQKKILADYKIDAIVLAKYMQIVSDSFIKKAPVMINIHHSFLPAFPGAKPYDQAYARGVKVIGATAHYVTSDLDAGPIIEQDVVKVSHRDEVADLVRKGKDLERVVLARAVRLHLEHRVLVYKGKTVVFE
jgi:formyltetrahydrofolate deformylase